MPAYGRDLHAHEDSCLCPVILLFIGVYIAGCVGFGARVSWSAPRNRVDIVVIAAHTKVSA